MLEVWTVVTFGKEDVVRDWEWHKGDFWGS